MAQYNLGLCFLGGVGVCQNFQKAVSLIKRAVKQNVASAQKTLAFCYDNAEGVKKSTKKASK